MIFIAVNQFKQYLAGLLEAGGGRGLRSVIINGLSTVLDLFPYLWGDFSYFGQLQSKGYFSYTWNLSAKDNVKQCCVSIGLSPSALRETDV